MSSKNAVIETGGNLIAESPCIWEAEDWHFYPKLEVSKEEKSQIMFWPELMRKTGHFGGRCPGSRMINGDYWAVWKSLSTQTCHPRSHAPLWKHFTKSLISKTERHSFHCRKSAVNSCNLHYWKKRKGDHFPPKPQSDKVTPWTAWRELVWRRQISSFPIRVFNILQPQSQITITVN